LEKEFLSDGARYVQSTGAVKIVRGRTPKIVVRKKLAEKRPTICRRRDRTSKTERGVLEGERSNELVNEYRTREERKERRGWGRRLLWQESERL